MIENHYKIEVIYYLPNNVDVHIVYGDKRKHNPPTPTPNLKGTVVGCLPVTMSASYILAIQYMRQIKSRKIICS